MKSMFNKVDFQEVKLEKIERIRSINKIEDGVFDISFNHIAHLRDGGYVEVDKSLCDKTGKDVLVVNVNDGEEVAWISLNTKKMSEMEKTYFLDGILTLIFAFIILSLIINPGVFISLAKDNFLLAIGYSLICLYICFDLCLRIYNDILIKAKTIHTIRSFKKKYRTKKEP